MFTFQDLFDGLIKVQFQQDLVFQTLFQRFETLHNLSTQSDKSLGNVIESHDIFPT
jgi:hypothetical protein